MTVHFTGNTIGTAGGSPVFGIKKPDGTWLTWTWSGASAFNLAPQTLSTTGTYTVVADPQLGNVGNFSVQVTSP